MLDRFAPLAHLLRMLIEATLDYLENVLMLPSRDPSLLGGGTAMFDGAVLADVGQVTAQDQSVFLGCECVGELLSGRTNVNVFVSHVAEVLLIEVLCVRGHRLWQRDRDACLVALQDFFAAEVAAVGDDIE